MSRDQLAATARRALATFGGFSAGQKAVTVSTVLLLTIGGYLFSTWAARPTLAPLYSNLSATDANAIVEKLSAGGTTYQLADGGQTILVPQDKVYGLRLTMSGAGLPSAKDTGYALLDKQGLTTSEFMQHVDYQRALEGELASTIGSIGGVHSATVHLAIPQQSVFTDSQQPTTASVLVATSPGETLSTTQVQAIVHLVSSSVVGLDPKRVTVADSTGTVLSTAGTDGTTTGAATAQAQQTQAFEQRLNASVQQMLDQVVGHGHAVVKVTAELNYDLVNTRSQTYVADPKLPPLSQNKTSETYTGTGTPGGGILGVGGTGAGAGTGAGTYARASQIQDNAVGMVTQTTDSAPGAIRRLAVAVLLDSRTSKGINPASVQQLVSSAVGLTAKRGDVISVTSLPFDQVAATQAEQALAATRSARQRQQLLAMARTGGMVLVALLLLLGAWRSQRKRRAELSADDKARIEEMRAALDRARLSALEAGEPAQALAASLPGIDPDEIQRQHRELAELIDRQPEDVAHLLRGWLGDRRSEAR
ncbi:MAG: flagellar M-ring protein FliF [Actinobacteria bacterium]|nr:flagellar M-ring protein FliF [Actinomycetota bacterium]